MKRICILGLAAALLAASVTSAAAASPKMVGNSVVYYQNSDGTVVTLTNAPGLVSKAGTDPARDAALLGTGATSANGIAAAATVAACSSFKDGPSYSCKLAASTTQSAYAPGKTKSIVVTSFSSSVKHVANCPSSPFGIPCQWRVNEIHYTTTSTVAWDGTDPFYANSIQICDSWIASGMAFTGFTVSWPVGVGFAQITNGVSYCTDAIANGTAWTITNITDGIVFKGDQLNGTEEGATSHTRLGTNWFNKTVTKSEIQ